jgi:hypothetical protein
MTADVENVAQSLKMKEERGGLEAINNKLEVHTEYAEHFIAYIFAHFRWPTS